MHDVIVIGGGAMGCSAAFHLAAPPHGARVAVIERDESYANAQTGWAKTGGVRRLHALPENIALSDASIAFYRDFARHTEVDGTGTDAAFVEAGYLVTASPGGIANLAANLELQLAQGVEAHWLEPEEVAARFPMVRPEGIGAAVHSPRDGWADPMRVLHGLRRASAARGVRFLAGEVAGFETAGRRVEAVRLASGERLVAPAFVLAAGPWSGVLAERAGLRLPVGPLLRYDFDFAGDEPSRPQPFLKDWARIAFRPFGENWRGGVQSTTMPRHFDLAIDPAFFDTVMRPALAERIRGFERVRLLGATAGLFDFNAFDQNAFIGPATGVLDNLYLLTGFSGHGFMHAPAAGRAVAELIRHGGFRSIDLSRLGFARLARNEPYADRRLG